MPAATGFIVYGHFYYSQTHKMYHSYLTHIQLRHTRFKQKSSIIIFSGVRLFAEKFGQQWW